MFLIFCSINFANPLLINILPENFPTFDPGFTRRGRHRKAGIWVFFGYVFFLKSHPWLSTLFLIVVCYTPAHIELYYYCMQHGIVPLFKPFSYTAFERTTYWRSLNVSSEMTRNDHGAFFACMQGLRTGQFQNFLGSSGLRISYLPNPSNLPISIIYYFRLKIKNQQNFDFVAVIFGWRKAK